MESWAKVSDAESWEILFSISPASFAVTVTTDSRLQHAQNFCGECLLSFITVIYGDPITAIRSGCSLMCCHQKRI